MESQISILEQLNESIHCPKRSKTCNVSYEYLTSVLEMLSSNYPNSSNFESFYASRKHFNYLLLLEKCIRNHKEYSLERTSEIFEKHIISLKPKKFLKNLYNSIENALDDRSPALLKALIKVGIKFEEHFNFWYMSCPTLNEHPDLSHEDRLQKLTDQCVDILLQNGWQIDGMKKDTGWCVVGKDLCRSKEYTPLLKAISNENSVVVRSLLTAKADVNISPTTNEGEPTLLHHYASYPYCKQAMLELVLDFGNPNLLVTDFLNRTSADIAKIKGNISVANYLDKARVKYNLEITNSLKCIPNVVSEIILQYLWSVRKLESLDMGLESSDSDKQESILIWME